MCSYAFFHDRARRTPWHEREEPLVGCSKPDFAPRFAQYPTSGIRVNDGGQSCFHVLAKSSLHLSRIEYIHGRIAYRRGGCLARYFQTEKTDIIMGNRCRRRACFSKKHRSEGKDTRIDVLFTKNSHKVRSESSCLIPHEYRSDSLSLKPDDIVRRERATP